MKISIDPEDHGLTESVAAEIAAQEGVKWETLRARGLYMTGARAILNVISNYVPKEGT